MDRPLRTRAVVVPLDPTPSQEQLLRSYCGSSRFAYNWAIEAVKANWAVRSKERQNGVDESELTKYLSSSAFTLTPLWNSVKGEVAPWHNDVTMHAFRSGVTNARSQQKSCHSRCKSWKGRWQRRPCLVSDSSAEQSCVGR